MLTLGDIADHLSGETASENRSIEIEKIESLDRADERSISFLVSEKHREKALECKAAAIIVPRECALKGVATVAVEDPYLGYALVAQLFEERTPVFSSRDRVDCTIASSAVIGKNCSIGPGCRIDEGVTIGDGSVIGANCVIEQNVSIGKGCRIDSLCAIRRNCVIGEGVIIQAGSIVGSEGFGNARQGAAYVRIPCFGSVVVEDNVEIGAGVTIDRGNFEPTRIKRGARIDNLVHIAHNVTIGEDTAVVAQVGISGSTTVGDRVIIAGQAGFVGHIAIGDDAVIGAKAGVSKSVPAKTMVTGYPAREFMKMRRIDASLNKLPDLVKEVRELRAKVKELSERCG